MPNVIKCGSSIQNFTKIGHEIWKLRLSVHLRPSVSYSMTVSSPAPRQFFYQNHLPQSEKRRSLRGLHIRCSLFYFVTNGQERSRTAAILHHCPHTHPRTHVETPTVSSPSLNLTQKRTGSQQVSVAVVVRRPLRLC